MGGRGAFLRIRGSGILEISIASYRDPQLLPTVRSAWNNAKHQDKIRFSIVSQGEDSEHPDLSFIPENQIRYQKFHWSESKGVCWAREIAMKDLNSTYFLQVDSHSRFVPDWDEKIIKAYEKAFKYHGSMIFTHHPEGYTVNDDGEDEYSDHGSWHSKVVPVWSDEDKMVGPSFERASDNPYGDEVYYLAAGSLFGYSDYFSMISYDPLLYFTGEEPSLALRFYTNGIKIVNTPIKFMYHEYKSSWKEGERKRPTHWEDDPQWAELNKAAFKRLSLILSGDMSLGIFGIGSEDLYNKWIQETGINLREKKDIIASWGE